MIKLNAKYKFLKIANKKMTRSIKSKKILYKSPRNVQKFIFLNFYTRNS